jgi:hypothetical protein
LKLILNQKEIDAAFGCRLEELGLANIDKASITVSFKSTRGTDGSTEAEVDFSFHEPSTLNTTQAPQPETIGNQPTAPEPTTAELSELDKPLDAGTPDKISDPNPDPSADDDAPGTVSDIFK